MGKQWKQWQTNFLSSKITEDSDCNHEIKRHFLLGKKVVTNLDKQRHQFANKGPYSQNYSFLSSHVWMWQLDHKEGWVTKNWWFWTVVLKKTLETPLVSKEIKPVNPKGIQPWLSTGRTDAEAPTLWPPDEKIQLAGKDTDAGKDWGQEKGVAEDTIVRWHHWLNGHEFEQTPGDVEGQGNMAGYSPHSWKESDTTGQLNNSKPHI